MQPPLASLQLPSSVRGSGFRVQGLAIKLVTIENACNKLPRARLQQVLKIKPQALACLFRFCLLGAVLVLLLLLPAHSYSPRSHSSSLPSHATA